MVGGLSVEYSLPPPIVLLPHRSDGSIDEATGWQVTVDDEMSDKSKRLRMTYQTYYMTMFRIRYMICILLLRLQLRSDVRTLSVSYSRDRPASSPVCGIRAEAGTAISFPAVNNYK